MGSASCCVPSREILHFHQSPFRLQHTLFSPDRLGFPSRRAPVSIIQLPPLHICQPRESQAGGSVVCETCIPMSHTRGEGKGEVSVISYQARTSRCIPKTFPLVVKHLMSPAARSFTCLCRIKTPFRLSRRRARSYSRFDSLHRWFDGVSCSHLCTSRP